MCKENSLINLEFEGKKLDYIIGEDGEPLFELYSVGMALGYVRSNGYVRKDRIDKIVSNADIKSFVHDGQKYLT